MMRSAWDDASGGSGKASHRWAPRTLYPSQYQVLVQHDVLAPEMRRRVPSGRLDSRGKSERREALRQCSTLLRAPPVQ